MYADLLTGAVSAAAFATMFRLACPILLGSIGGCFNNVSGCLNIAYEAIMLYACFFSVWGSYLTGSPFVGLLFAIGISIVIAVLFGVMVFTFNANNIIVATALNSSAWAVTTLLMTIVFGVRGSVYDDRIISFEPIHFKFLERFPVLNEIFNDNVWLVYLSYVLVIVGYVVMYKTPFGLRIRGIGQNDTAAMTAGINVVRYKWIALLLMGIFTGIAGTALTLSGLSMFSENMTAGRGFLCMCSIAIAKGNPLKIFLVAMLFAYSQSLVIVFGMRDLPTQLITMIPYAAALIVLFVNGLKSFKGTADIEM